MATPAWRTNLLPLVLFISSWLLSSDYILIVALPVFTEQASAGIWGERHKQDCLLIRVFFSFVFVLLFCPHCTLLLFTPLSLSTLLPSLLPPLLSPPSFPVHFFPLDLPPPALRILKAWTLICGHSLWDVASELHHEPPEVRTGAVAASRLRPKPPRPGSQPQVPPNHSKKKRQFPLGQKQYRWRPPSHCSTSRTEGEEETMGGQEGEQRNSRHLKVTLATRVRSSFHHLCLPSRAPWDPMDHCFLERFSPRWV